MPDRKVGMLCFVRQTLLATSMQHPSPSSGPRTRLHSPSTMRRCESSGSCLYVGPPADKQLTVLTCVSDRDGRMPSNLTANWDTWSKSASALQGNVTVANVCEGRAFTGLATKVLAVCLSTFLRNRRSISSNKFDRRVSELNCRMFCIIQDTSEDAMERCARV